VLRQFSYEETGLALVSLGSKMPAHLKPTIVRTYRQQQQSKQLEYWQKLIDDHTAEQFERDTAAKTHLQLSGCQLE